MDEKLIRDTIFGLEQAKSESLERFNQLKEEYETLQLEIDRFNFSIDSLEKRLSNFSNSHYNIEKTEVVGVDKFSTGDFPINASTKVQALYLLKEIGKISRLKDLEQRLAHNLNKPIDAVAKMRSPIFRLKDEGKVVGVRFNNAWQQVFYGLTEWLEIDESGNRNFKQQYRPTNDALPYGYETIDFEYESQKPI